MSEAAAATGASGEATGARDLWLANGVLLLTVIVWGIPLPLVEWLLPRWEPVTLSAARYVFAAPVLWAVLLWRSLARPDGHARTAHEFRTAPWGRILLLGGIGMAGFATCFTLGIQLSGAVMIAIIVSSNPIVAGFVLWALTGQRPSRSLALAALVAVLGGTLAGLDFSDGLPRVVFGGGEILMVAAIALWCWYTLMLRRWLPGWSALGATTLTVGASLAVFSVVLPILIWIGLEAPPPAEPAALDIAVMAWLSISIICVGVVGWNLAVARIGLLPAAIVLNLVPLVAVLTATVMGTIPTPEQLAGGAIVIAGVLYTQLSEARRLRRLRRPAPLSTSDAEAPL